MAQVLGRNGADATVRSYAALCLGRCGKEAMPHSAVVEKAAGSKDAQVSCLCLRCLHVFTTVLRLFVTSSTAFVGHRLFRHHALVAVLDLGAIKNIVQRGLGERLVSLLLRDP